MSETIRSPSVHNRIWAAFADKAYRSAFATAHVGDFLAMQLQSLRVRRGWTQTDLAQKLGSGGQPKISKLETSCEGTNLSTLQKLADTFDVALVVKFVPFSELAREAMGAQADKHVPSFEEDSPNAISFSSLRFSCEPQPRASGGTGYVRKLPDVGTSRSVQTLTPLQEQVS